MAEASSSSADRHSSASAELPEFLALLRHALAGNDRDDVVAVMNGMIRHAIPAGYAPQTVEAAIVYVTAIYRFEPDGALARDQVLAWLDRLLG